jgi:uncharacterized coiled-coil protein SlyX
MKAAEMNDSSALDLADPKLRYPFDQYQRYKVAADLIDALGVRPGSRLLEVGGAPGPIEEFIPGHDIIVTDLNGKKPGRYAIADGSRLPFPDESFDAVISLDTLEHVPRDRRADFCSELRRVSRDLVVLSAPFASTEVKMAEEALNSFVRARFGDFPTLDEHSEHGLPELDFALEALGGGGFATSALPSGYLPRWLLGMLFHHELLAGGLPELPEIHAYYNATVSALDARAPSYRHAIVAARARPKPELDQAVDSLRAPGNDAAGQVALGSIASVVLARRMPASNSPAVAHLEEVAARQERAVVDLERQVADRDAHIAELRATVDRLTGERDQAQSLLLEHLTEDGLAGLISRVTASVRKKKGPQ